MDKKNPVNKEEANQLTIWFVRSATMETTQKTT